MAFCVDDFLGHRMRGDAYNCAHFAGEVWAALTGEDLSDRLTALLSAIDPSERSLVNADVQAFTRLKAPLDPCFVVMKRPRTTAHVGVYVRGKVLHLQHNGVEFMELEVACRGFTRTSFYR